eukprot:757732-Hanusia_phi.AAC.1
MQLEPYQELQQVRRPANNSSWDLLASHTQRRVYVLSAAPQQAAQLQLLSTHGNFESPMYVLSELHVEARSVHKNFLGPLLEPPSL